ncbi:Predicted dehydrogenase [Filimonas lacunae]|uniref:Predicted dehydrogenase n=1 Tax=Filimonas lacunae TaxID=477680 RepID=A0A173MC82_9BACT|nr:Gfo/Idh/MocA family oxidoreductase [Filimonas lacunae]BAV05155.1 oxidoreductase, Gfo/Idh/MocA family [Filimonas lacunae]SIT34144.1 Predicted dehydrogenase [Filimonas lacunae]
MVPIYVIGAGGIVNDAHLPAYRLAGYEVAGIYDKDLSKATATAARFAIPHVFDSLQQLIQHAPGNAIYDVALPATAMLQVLQQLPEKANVLLQKPMGNNLEEAQEILTITRQKQQRAGVNFQLRYAPFIKAARELINAGTIGELCDIEVNVNVYTPWHLWDFLYQSPRVEILYHSIHYIDLVRSFFGNPTGILAKTTKHPSMPQLASVRSNIIMDYGDWLRANILTNHGHNFGLHNQHAYVKFEGTKGAIKATLGSLINYPHGIPDRFEYIQLTEGQPAEWQTVAIEGSWFPHAFVGSMEQMMLAVEGKIAKPDNSVEDAIYTMECVEQAYKSNV